MVRVEAEAKAFYRFHFPENLTLPLLFPHPWCYEHGFDAGDEKNSKISGCYISFVYILLKIKKKLDFLWNFQEIL